MFSRGRRGACGRFALVAIGALGACGGELHAQTVGAAAPPQPLEITLRDDAALNSVYFVERAIGWAVGDRGVIWHTRDAGASWQQQTSPVNCALNSVFFLDAARGWAVGGAHKPFSASTSGVVLRTVDGGATWSVAAAQGFLPMLNGARFFDARHGVAYGAAGPMSPSGVFATRDGGSTWQPLACGKSGLWLAGDFLAPDVGAVAGPNGRFATIASTDVVDSPLASGSSRALRAMRLVSPTAGWLVGDGGLIAQTSDLGRSWQLPSGELPAQAIEKFDFRAVAVDGPRVWIVGSPGTQVIYTPDGGQTWQAFATRQMTPLRGVTFVDATHGWAVGDLGAILATNDGGQTWQTQRSGGRRAALLAVFARPVDVPIELIAQQGAAESYLAAVEIPFRASDADGVNGTTPLSFADVRSHEAMLASGATSSDMAWRYLLPPNERLLEPKDLLAALDRVADGRAVERLVAHMVQRIRMWRPDLILTHHGHQEFGEPLGSLIQQIALKSVEAAADAQQFGDLADAGLAPWQVKRVYGVLPPGSRGIEKTATGQFSPMLGKTFSDWSASARRLLFAEHSAPPDVYELELLTYATKEGQPTNENADGRGMFRGIALAPGGEARRRFSALPAGDIDQLRRLAARRRNLEELLERSEGNPAWAAQVVQLTDGLDAEASCELFFQLADGYRAKGQLDLAADTYYLLARKHPEHPLTEQALRWLIQFYASSEAGTRMINSGVGPSIRTNTNADAADSVANEVPREVLRGTETNAGKAIGTVVQASATAALSNQKPPASGLSRDERLRRAVELGKYLETARPALFAEPDIRFPIVAAERQLGFANPAKRYFLSLGSLPESDPWKRCAITEQWLAEPSGSPPPKILGHSRRASGRPHLDGKLDEALWQGTEALRVGRKVSPVPDEAGNLAPDNGAEVRALYDEEFLYLAVRSAKIDGMNYQPDDRPRPHDGDVSSHDRFALRFDVDRDYTTHFELTIDHRGWTRDTCWNDANWNPSWFVAAAQDATTWTIEAAIPLAEIAVARPQARTVWALGIERTIPRVGSESWGGEKVGEHSPDQYGLLIFD